MSMRWVCAATIACLAMAGCNDASRTMPAAAGADAPAAAATTGQPATQAGDAAFVAAQDAWRQARNDDLRKADGWNSLVGLHWIEPGPHYVGSAAQNGIRLAMGPAHLGMFDLRGGSVHLTPDKDAGLLLDGAPLRKATALRSDADEAGPSVLSFDDGKGIATVIKRGDRYALRVKHADAPGLAQFKGVTFWPADPSWRITGKFIPNAPGKTLQIANIIGMLDDVPNPGAIEFARDGRTYRLEALGESDGLSLLLADRTSGHDSYGAGRYLDAAAPDAAGNVVLDFNQAYNPPCAFTAFATCPLPPNDNRLDLAVTAGEKAYGKVQ